MPKVNATILLIKQVEDNDKAADWYAEVHEALQGHTECEMRSRAINHEPPVEITK